MSNQALYFSFKNGFGSAPNILIDMSMISTDPSPSQISGYPVSGSSSPCKEALPSIDFSEIIKAKKLDKSKLSTNDSFSIRTDDDTLKSFISFESLSGEVIFKGKPKTKKTPPEEQTLKEIISKRVYIKAAKNPGSENNASAQNSNKRRNPHLDSPDSEESITKKEKREDDAMRLFSTNQEPVVPQIVFKDGKAQLDISSQEQVHQKPLVVVTGNQKKVTTSRSFKKMSNTEKWSEYDTKKFYRALEFFGTDFSTIGKLFKNRSHNQIKNKFLKEEKVAPQKIDAVFCKGKTANFGSLMQKYKKIHSRNNLLHHKNAENCISVSNARVPENLLQGISVKREKSETDLSDTSSLDSVDLSIMEDLADIFLPQKQVGILPKEGVKFEEYLSLPAKLL